MSIVALKRNSRRFKVPISGSSQGFSINGGLRNQGRVGQTSLGRANIRGFYKGAFQVGNGGCCGKYFIENISNGIYDSNQPNIIKRSNMNTNGYILSKIIHPTPVLNSNCNSSKINWVQPVENDILTKLNVKNTCGDKFKYKFARDCDDIKNPCTTRIGTKKITYTPFVKTYFKDSGALSYGEYNKYRLLSNNCLPTPDNMKHFPYGIPSGGCRKIYYTPEEAKADGALPSNCSENIGSGNKCEQLCN